MKLLLCVLILLVPILTYGNEHPVEEAEIKLEAAQESLKVALERIDKAIRRIEDKDKQKATSKAFSDAQMKWIEFVRAEILTFLAATPASETSNAVLLGIYYTETLATEARVKDLTELAELLETNYK